MTEARRRFPSEPTAEQCSARERLPDFNERKAFACWYPQMGGYVGKAVVVVPYPKDRDPDDSEAPCFEAFVWHDGEFAFANGREPIRLHHCSAEQFIRFGNEVRSMTEDPAK